MSAGPRAAACRGIFAAGAKAILPTASLAPLSEVAPFLCATLSLAATSRRPRRDSRRRADIMTLTLFAAPQGGTHEPDSRYQTRGPAPAGRLLHPPSRGHRCPLSHARILRSLRPGPGQVRDAPPRRDRGVRRHHRRGGVWLLAGRVLPG